MKRYAKVFAATALTAAMLSGAATAFAAGSAPQTGDTAAATQAARPEPPDGGLRRGGPRHGGVEGEVTAVSGESLTVLNRQGESVTVTLTASTTVRLMLTDADGSLSDVKVGSNAQIMGRPDADGKITARQVVVAPAGDQASGRVTAVDGSTITVETRDGTRKILTAASTQFVSAGEKASLSDVAAGDKVTAYGEAGSDGTLTATAVLIGGQGRGPEPRGAKEGGRPPAPAAPAEDAGDAG
jgi:hypothetical protein